MAQRAARDDLDRRLMDAAQEARRPIDRDEIAGIVQDVLASMEGDLSATDIRLYNEIQGMARYIERARADIASIKPDEIRSEHIPTATDELDAVIGATEDATGTILECCESIENVASDLDEANAQRLTDTVTRIYEACSFQDITGQRIAKVVSALKHIEEKVDALVKTFGDEVATNAPSGSTSDESSVSAEDADSEEELKAGPQLPGEGINQDEIDRLLNSFD